MTVMSSLVRVALVGVAAGALAGCAGSGGQQPGAQPPASFPISSPPPGVGSVTPPAGGRLSGHPTTVSGTLERGAEPSCLVLRSATGTFDLQGRLVEGLRPEQRVKVRGHVVRGVASHCMDGTPFQVTAVLSR